MKCLIYGVLRRDIAGSSPVYRFYNEKDIRKDILFVVGAKRSHSPALRILVSASLRSAQSRGPPDLVRCLSLLRKRSHSPALRILVSASLRSAQNRRPLDVLRPSIAPAPFGARSSSVSTSFRSFQSRHPPDVVKRSVQWKARD